MLHLWAGVVAEIRRRGADLVFGAGSFPGTDPTIIGPLVRLLEQRYAAPAAIRPKVRPEGALALDGIAASRDAVRAMRDVPPLLKSYLRAGARIGEGAWVDRDLGLTDVCIVLDRATAIWPAEPGARG
jgi:putative hemolysin